MCPQKVCPKCCLRIPAHVTECTTNGCRHIFDDSQPSVAPIGRTYPAGTDPDLDGMSEAGILRHYYLN